MSDSRSEMDDYYERSRKPLIPAPQTPAQRVLYGVVIAVWFIILMLPFAMFWLAIGNEITIGRGDAIPEADQHPRLQISLIMDVDNRGLRLFTTNVQRENETALCVEGYSNYVLWQSEDENNNATYCQCYEREHPDADWQFVAQTLTTCTPD